MSDKVFSWLVKKYCSKEFTLKQIHNEECERWNKSQRGCSLCPELKEKQLHGYVAVLESSLSKERRTN